MGNYFHTFWISKHGKKELYELIGKVCSKTKIPEKVKQEIEEEEYLFNYFFIVYCIVGLNYFGLNNEQISFFLDLCMTLGTCKAFPPAKILEEQKDVISDIVTYIKEDLKIYKGE